MNYQEIQNQLKKTQSWQQCYREIMLFGKQLPVIPDCLKNDDALIQGCESKVWLHIDLDESRGTILLIGDSDTRIVKGLFAIISSMYNDITLTEAKNIDAYAEFESLGLIKHLSPSRGNGIQAIIKAIQEKLSQW
ncbi:SufE family protein [Pseudoalteromonas sp. MMG005]|uniref:SufE family protein n=1 Tax=Pseudoalteromonas sp. MMG005 TaxID=2822682 RepID=UPI001B3A0DEF|nr:SufE family protein [Pseudoalteromonas sp. MMG005]MBQ4845591.1 SufE family protein [Pseudoalteromonas sp. MMG005]